MALNKIELQTKIYVVSIICSMLLLFVSGYMVLREPVKINLALNPPQVFTQDYFILNLDIKNNLEETTAFLIQIDLPNGISVTDTNEFTETIESKKTESKALRFYVSPNLNPSKYSIKITISYKDEKGEIHSIQKNPTINVVSKI